MGNVACRGKSEHTLFKKIQIVVTNHLFANMANIHLHSENSPIQCIHPVTMCVISLGYIAIKYIQSQGLSDFKNNVLCKTLCI